MNRERELLDSTIVSREASMSRTLVVMVLLSIAGAGIIERAPATGEPICGHCPYDECVEGGWPGLECCRGGECGPCATICETVYLFTGEGACVLGTPCWPDPDLACADADESTTQPDPAHGS